MTAESKAMYSKLYCSLLLQKARNKLSARNDEIAGGDKSVKVGIPLKRQAVVDPDRET